MKINNDSKKILVLGDFLSSGNVGGSLVRDVLSFYSFEVDFIPTSLISNKFSLKPIEIQETTTYLKNTLDVFKKQKKSYDAIFIGYVNKNQVSIIKDFIIDFKTLVIVDPIMGDKGKLYNCLDYSIIDTYKNLVKYADIILPNYTECSLLTDNKFSNPTDILDFYKNLGKKVVITSFKDKNRFFIYGIDNKIIKEEFEYISHSFGGTGDLFDALFLINYLKDYNFYDSIINTKNEINKILKTQVKLDDKTNDIYIGDILKDIYFRK